MTADGEEFIRRWAGTNRQMNQLLDNVMIMARILIFLRFNLKIIQM
jgi:hypothetical protein